MTTQEETPYFTNKLSDKALRAKSEKLVCENPNDANTLQIVLKQQEWSEKQREWVTILIGRKGKKFVFVEETSKKK